jgi:hypothetical protein
MRDSSGMKREHATDLGYSPRSFHATYGELFSAVKGGQQFLAFPSPSAYRDGDLSSVARQTWDGQSGSLHEDRLRTPNPMGRGVVVAVLTEAQDVVVG